MNEPILIDASDAAALLSTTRGRILTLARKKLIPSVDIGDGQPRFSIEALRAMADGNWATDIIGQLDYEAIQKRIQANSAERKALLVLIRAARNKARK